MLGEGFGESNGGRSFEEPLKSMTLDDWGDEEQINREDLIIWRARKVRKNLWRPGTLGNLR